MKTTRYSLAPYLGKRKLAALDIAIARGHADVAAGRGKPAAEVFDRLEAKYSRMIGGES